jgi:hypothetical protein
MLFVLDYSCTLPLRVVEKYLESVIVVDNRTIEFDEDLEDKKDDRLNFLSMYNGRLVKMISNQTLSKVMEWKTTPFHR